ncbi:hypothetical protein EDD30_3356 [Couchioplanes caeruleus]|uniref:Uncharacterized protein n=1 Tax=Couchioplanes caeruleus TaxID=56438 RepID=A0A3N1GK19_9ACTN|nr:hypothetical protein EDD30_3356 [Couchioplanes caeruleus]
MAIAWHTRHCALLPHGWNQREPPCRHPWETGVTLSAPWEREPPVGAAGK